MKSAICLKKIVVVNALCVLICLMGCKAKPAEANTSRLKETLKRTDVVLIKHFYPEASASEDANPKYQDLRPGLVTIEPAWVYEPSKEAAGLKGAIMMARESYFFRTSGDMEGGKKDEAVLDLDELKDMDSALSAMQAANAPWRSSSQGDYIEMLFSAKDSFSATVFKKEDGGEMLVIKAGIAEVPINLRNVPSFQKGVQSAISLLESKGK